MEAAVMEPAFERERFGSFKQIFSSALILPKVDEKEFWRNSDS